VSKLVPFLQISSFLQPAADAAGQPLDRLDLPS